jgi:integrase
VKITRKRYQQGSIRKVARAKGFVWEYRYYVPSEGKRKLKTQTFRGKLYATEADVRRAVGAMVPHLNDGTPYTPPVAVTFGTLLDRYIAEELPPRKSTRDSYTSIIKNHLRPRWENMVLSDIKPALIHSWFQSIKLQPISKGHVVFKRGSQNPPKCAGHNCRRTFRTGDRWSCCGPEDSWRGWSD